MYGGRRGDRRGGDARQLPRARLLADDDGVRVEGGGRIQIRLLVIHALLPTGEVGCPGRDVRLASEGQGGGTSESGLAVPALADLNKDAAGDEEGKDEAADGDASDDGR